MENHNQQAPSQKIKRGPVHEGPKNHFIAFGISMVLTFLAFVAVLNENLSPKFINSFLIIMAVVQVIVQLYFWMHMKDRGHTYAKIFMAFGVVIVFTIVLMAEFWVWW